MAQDTPAEPVSGPQRGMFSYFRFNPQVHTREKPYEILVNLPPPAPGSPPIKRHNQEFEERETVVEDARGREGNFTLDGNGFCWRKWGGPGEWRGVDAEALKRMGDDGVRSGYIAEAESFLREELEKEEGRHIDIVKVFDYRLRVHMDSRTFQKRTLDLDDGLDPLLPVSHPHVDQSRDGAVLRVREHMKDRADELLQRRFRIINIWKPLKRVYNWPLAVCDSTTVRPTDLIVNDLVRRRYIGESYYSKYNAGHRWYYLSNQEPDEVTLLKIHDSDARAAVRFSLHSAFDLGLPNSSRESFEVRALVFDSKDAGEADANALEPS